jgi:hypothetical protein
VGSIGCNLRLLYFDQCHQNSPLLLHFYRLNLRNCDNTAKMETVPETERIEEFTVSPVPRLRLQASSVYVDQVDNREVPTKPPTIRRSTDPTPHSPHSPISASPIPYRPRNISPYSRGHLRSKSQTSALAQPMSRAQSLPGFNGAGQILFSTQHRSASPHGSPSRARALRKPVDDVFPGLPNRGLKDISETGPLTLHDEIPTSERSSSPDLGLPLHNTFPRSRRPSSPLRYTIQPNATTGLTAPNSPSGITSWSSYQSSRFDSFLNANAYTGTLSYPGSFASSSVPSTPTSARSRSPSISSLETIPDSPDAEEAALEADRIAQLKVAADAADGVEELKAKALLEASGGRGRTLGVSFGSRDKRKRWSVCGAERRGDLNLDTIWED